MTLADAPAGTVVRGRSRHQVPGTPVWETDSHSLLLQDTPTPGESRGWVQGCGHVLNTHTLPISKGRDEATPLELRVGSRISLNLTAWFNLPST